MIKLRVTDIKQYVYCPRIIYFTYVCPVDKKNTRKMEYGKEAHIELDRLEKRRTFKRYNFSNAERKYHTKLYSARLGLEGRLDMLILADGEIFPVEFKYTRGGPSLNHKYQLMAYAMLLEDTYNKPVRYGFLHLHPEGNILPVEITPNGRLFIKDIMEKIRTLVSQERMPSPTYGRARCVDCEYRNFCNDVR
ncbi:CRISPR-associated protein Cas4 [Desulforamulus hydrothermalis]|uniref:CRISPR-associated exonuclease Cas4 n=1 Tax=Desulforamulus hydrothermalis Lam5 = DSM 18033 TaxID=1121428 RepID=K8E876_9FIRM|nr:CRISPR-associated protein Cas4 [Desulforamulus hydrothermalis]CCO07703.1 CRISPR-associated protein Cas4 [Desulforamulus hydrothermalis Lam5 = DSM 18033]SHH25680.1 CRISPR-associated exonuclease, Cas4 family [Desulforamulus hydrothermalis Lam5 = DSM 18033]